MLIPTHFESELTLCMHMSTQGYYLLYRHRLERCETCVYADYLLQQSANRFTRVSKHARM